jgi:TRAP transporter TAXI family solute receptor
MGNKQNNVYRAMIRPYLAALSIALVVVAVRWDPVLAQSKPDIRIATGRQGGAYYSMGALLAEALHRSGKVASATAESSSGAIESARLLDRGKVSLGGMDANWVKLALSGAAPFKKKIELVTVAPLGVWPLFFVTRQDSPIKTLDDLKGKKIAVGAKGSGMEQHARKVLGALGWSFDDIKPIFLSFGPGGRAVREGKADAQLQCCVPNRGLTELSELAKVRTVEMPPDELARIVAGSGVYGEIVLPKGAFRGQERDMKVLRLLNGWMAAKGSDSEVAYLIAKTLIANLDEMAKKMPQYATVKLLFEEAKTKGKKAIEVVAPLHPGAVKAYKEAGILK